MLEFLIFRVGLVTGHKHASVKNRVGFRRPQHEMLDFLTRFFFRVGVLNTVCHTPTLVYTGTWATLVCRRRRRDSRRSKTGQAPWRSSTSLSVHQPRRWPGLIGRRERQSRNLYVSSASLRFRASCWGTGKASSSTSDGWTTCCRGGILFRTCSAYHRTEHISRSCWTCLAINSEFRPG